MSMMPAALAPLPDLVRAVGAHESLTAYVSGTIYPDGQPRPFDSYHYDYYLQRANDPAVINARQQMAWGHMHLANFAGGTRVLYLPEAITGGVDAHRLAVASNNRTLKAVRIGKHDFRLLTTRDLGLGEAGKERLLHDVIEINKRAALHHVSRVQKNFPAFTIVSPFDKEGMVRAGRSNSNVSFGRQPEEEDFMGGWYHEVDIAGGIVNFGDWAFSRNSNWENMRGLFNAAGFMNGITRRENNFAFYRPDATLSTLAERMEDQVAYLMYALENGFHAEEAATTLAWELEIDRRLRDPTYNASTAFPIDYRHISPALRAEFHGTEGWAENSRAGIDRLRPVAEALLLNYFAAHIPDHFMGALDHRYPASRNTIGMADQFTLPSTLEHVGLDEKEPEVARLLGRARAPDSFKIAAPPQGSLRLIATPAFESAKLPHAPKLATMPVPQQIADRHDVFKEPYKARLFDDDPYENLSEAEQIALQQAIGAAMTNRPPLLYPGWVLVLHDFRAGLIAEKKAHELQASGKMDVADIALVQDVMGDDRVYNAEIVSPEMKRLQDFLDGIRDRHSKDSGFVPPVISSFDVLAGHIAYNASPDLTAVSHGKPQSNKMRLAMNLKMIDLFATEMPMIDGWEKSPDQAQFIVRATLVQLGLVKRGYGHRYNLVVTGPQGNEMSLYDRFAPLYKELKASYEQGRPSKQHALAVARLVALHEILIDARQNIGMDGQEIVDMNAIHESVTAYRTSPDRAVMDQMAREARDFVLHNCVDLFSASDIRDFEYLDPDYKQQWLALQGELEGRLAPDSNRTRFGSMNDPGSGPG